MVAITGELGPVPERMLDLSRIDALRGIALQDGSLVLGARTTYTEIRKSALLSRAPAGARRGIGDDRRGADPEPRARSVATSPTPRPAGDTLPILLAAMPRSSSAVSVASARSPRRTSSSPIERRPWRPTS
jgi:hypothetical protein